MSIVWNEWRDAGSDAPHAEPRRTSDVRSAKRGFCLWALALGWCLAIIAFRLLVATR